MDVLTVLEEVRADLEREFRLPHQAGSLGTKIYELYRVLGANHDEVCALVTRFKARLHASGYDDLAVRQMHYAIRLADSSGKLLYEELHKLLSLCDEIHALQSLGLWTDPQVEQTFQAAVRSRLNAQRREARLAATDKATEGNRSRWWYSLLLDP